MIQVKKEGVILEKTNLEFENTAVLNPAVIEDDGKIHMFYRAVRTGNNSTIGYCTLSDPLTIEERFDYPVLFPEFEYESQGVEDPRIVKIENTFYMTYTAYDGFYALGALALSQDLTHFFKAGIIAPSIHYKDFAELAAASGPINKKYFRFDQMSMMMWDKNVVFFPRKIDGQLVFLHRIRPGIQIVFADSIDDLKEDFWTEYIKNFADNILMDPMYDHESSYIGGGCPPIETSNGWLLIYHGVRDTISGYIYSACAALLDLQNPRVEIGRLPYPLFSPQADWEINGEIENVCFPTGSYLNDDTLYIYYGAADKQIACASLNINELLSELLSNSTRT